MTSHSLAEEIQGWRQVDGRAAEEDHAGRLGRNGRLGRCIRADLRSTTSIRVDLPARHATGGCDSSLLSPAASDEVDLRIPILLGVTLRPDALPDRSDEELARDYCNGEVASLEELIRRYMKPIFNFAFRMTGNYAEADDIAQDVFVQIYRSLPSARLDLPFRPWLYVIARNKCLDNLKRKRALDFSALEDPETHESPIDAVADPDPLPDAVLERNDLQRILREAIVRLPERYRVVVSLRYAGGLSFAEVAETLALPENTVKTHFQRAKALLRKELAAEL
jgi:RNA polymerase sigma factor (sigma-70 family)